MRYLKRVILFVVMITVSATMTAAQAEPVPFSRSIWNDVERRAKEYAKLRERQQASLPKLSTEATPEQIQRHKQSLQKLVSSAREGARQGDIFSEPSPDVIKALIRKAYQGWERTELRRTVLEADTKGVPLAVNAIYPETKELVEMSPPLLLALPQLPKELRYRFIGRSLVILDRDSGLVVDFIREALP